MNESNETIQGWMETRGLEEAEPRGQCVPRQSQGTSGIQGWMEQRGSEEAEPRGQCVPRQSQGTSGIQGWMEQRGFEEAEPRGQCVPRPSQGTRGIQGWMETRGSEEAEPRGQCVPNQSQGTRGIQGWMEQRGFEEAEPRGQCVPKQSQGMRGKRGTSSSWVRLLNACVVGLIVVALPWQWLNATERPIAPERPNIVYILADDLGYGDLGCYSSASKIPTPRLDQLASQGMRFRDAHSPSAVCSPTRYALLTGRYAWRTRLQRNVLGPWEKPLIAEDRLTVGRLLQQQGYTTACIGKWHLGQNYVTTDGKPAVGGTKNALSNVDFTQPIGDGPITRGFDHYFGTLVPNYPPYCFIENDRTVGVPSVPMEGEQFNIPGPRVPGWKLVDILPEMTRHAVRWIDKAAETKQPFFLYFSLTSPHYPVVPAPEFKGKTEVGAYGDFVHQTDWSIGQVLEALDRAGVADNTLVIFTSDNGPEITGEVKPGAYDRVQQYGHRSSGELRGAKRDAWEGGHRVPFIARWPGKIEAGAVSDEVICHVDFMATVAAILGLHLPDNAAEDSVNILPALLGNHGSVPIREATVHHSVRGKFAIRQGDWVLIDAPSGDDNGANGEPGWLKDERGYTPHEYPGELFHMGDDLAQRHNRYGEQPEIVSKLHTLLKSYIDNGRSTPGEPQRNDVEIQAYSAQGNGAKAKRAP